MDKQTVNYYDSHAGEMAERYRGAMSVGIEQYFAEAFPEIPSRILDVGAGSGRDMDLLQKAGYDVYGLEPSSGLRNELLRCYPSLAGRIWPYPLPLPEDTRIEGKFDGILCAAVLMHVPEQERRSACSDLTLLLRPGGRLLISVPGVRTGINAADRDPKGRLFALLDRAAICDLFMPLGFDLLRCWRNNDKLDRAIDWETYLLQRNDHA